MDLVKQKILLLLQGLKLRLHVCDESLGEQRLNVRLQPFFRRKKENGHYPLYISARFYYGAGGRT